MIEIPKVFKLLRELEVPRICFYHLVYSGRGSEMIKEDLNHAETRSVVDLIMDETRALFDAGMPKEVLTVDNHADGPYVWMRMLKEDQARRGSVPASPVQRGQQLRSRHRLYLVGRQVHADQFWRNHTFGNVLDARSPKSGTIRTSNCSTR